jgi:L-ascorbate metabolism protein UlaG (beta-lactamase superfamily)
MVYALIVLILAGLVLFYNTWAPFGGRLGGARKERAMASKLNKDGTFQNLIDTPTGIRFREGLSLLADQLRGNPDRRPARPLQPETFDPVAFVRGAKTRLVWLGHSTVLLRLNGKNILFDPIFSKRASPFQWAGPKRFAGGLRVGIADLPPIDAVVISHDHYDHLDYASIRQLRAHAQHFFVPLGVGAHLERWGVSTGSITELEWWQSAPYSGLQFTCTPSRHFSGRRIGGHDKTLWASWVVTSTKERVYFSGDTGYGPHFAEIGKRYGPFNLTLLECGQYDKAWPNVHMMPEQTVQAAKDLGTKLLVPIHWGAFVLALHAWAEPVERAGEAAMKLQIRFATPRLGQVLPVQATRPAEAWWSV